jgi:hypothetical protein
MSAKCQKRTLAVSISDRIAPRYLAEPRRAQLWCPLQRCHVYPEQSELWFVAQDPFEVVHCAPVEPTAHRHALGRRPLKLGEA